ncbi:MAG: hypothetical protein PVJ84_14560, partial [Desulfobacteraceae bacterium]
VVLHILRSFANHGSGAHRNALKWPEGPRVKASEGEVVLIILRTFGNDGSGALRPFQSLV